MLFRSNAVRYKTWIYLAGSASAEFFADIGLCPFEAVKVRMQTTIPPFAKGTFDGISKIVSSEGIGGSVSLIPLQHAHANVRPVYTRVSPHSGAVKFHTP